VCIDGKIAFWNICVYRPRPLTARQEEWISPQTVVLRDFEARSFAGGGRWARAVLQGARLSDGIHAHGVVPHGKG